MASSPLAVDSIIELNDGRLAAVRFVGQTSFAPGEWIGVELETQTGKNDGSVQGDRYFDAEPGYGMFLRPSGVSRIVEEPRKKPVAKTLNGAPAVAAVKSGPGSISLGRAAVDGRRQSTVASPIPKGSVPPSGLRSPTKSPTKQLLPGSRSTSRAGTSPTATSRRPATTAATRPRPSLAPASTPTSKRTTTVPSSAAPVGRTAGRPSISGPGARAPPPATNRAVPGRVVPGRQSLAPRSAAPVERLSGVSGGDRSEASSVQSLALSPTERPSTPQENEEEEGESVEDDSEDDSEDEEDEEKNEEEEIQQPVKPTAPPPVPSVKATVSRRTSSPASKPAVSRRTSSPPASLASHRFARPAAASNREVEDLRTKLTLLERRRLEDREKLKTMERIQTERDRFENIIKQLQTKYQPQQAEMADLRRQLKESESRFSSIEDMQAEQETALESATLDREMAEEQADLLRIEIDTLREKNEEMELELEILRDENAELGQEMNPEERTSQGWLQMERSNERLREALLRLRDMTQEQEAELKEQIKSLEAEVQDGGQHKQAYEELQERLDQSEAAVENLKQQLEVAQGAEEFIETLGDDKLRLQEDVEELRAELDDYRIMKELADELEINHVEAEKQYLEEIDYKNSVMNEQARRSQQENQMIEDLELTVSKFRQLVSELQAKLEEMRATQQISETESEELSSKTRAMMEMNMKLQNSAAKTQVKAIELELKRLDAEQAAEHLAIVQLFLPEAFHTERDSILALLRFRRIGFKARLVQGSVKERVSGQGARAADEDIFAACNVLDKLAWVSAMGERFVNSICGCSVEEFAKYESALYELEPVERALNSYIDGLKREDLKERSVDDELKRSMAVMSHLASIHIQENLSTFADSILMSTTLMQSHLDSTASALSLCKSMVQNKAPTVDGQEDASDSTSQILNQLDSSISHIWGAKFMASKAHMRLTDLHSRSLSLDPSSLSQFSAAESATSTLSEYARAAGEGFLSLFSEEGRTEPYTYPELTLALSNAATAVFGLNVPEPAPFSALGAHLRTLTDALTDVAALPADLENTHEFSRLPAPWVQRSAELKATKITAVDTEAEVARLNEVLRERSLLVRAKEQELEEQSVKIEMLEARMRDAGKRGAQIAELEDSIRELKGMEKELREEMSESRRVEVRLRSERDEWKAVAEEAKARDRGRKGDVEGGGASRMELEREKGRVLGLQGTVRWLQGENSRLRIPVDRDLEAKERLNWLSEPLIPTPNAKQQRRELVRAEGKDVLNELLKMAGSAKMVDLKSLPEDKLAWRPVKQTSAWEAQRKREEWEVWREWKGDVVKKARELSRPEIASKQHSTKAGKLEGGAVGKVNHGGKTVRIVDPDGFQDVLEVV